MVQMVGVIIEICVLKIVTEHENQLLICLHLVLRTDQVSVNDRNSTEGETSRIECVSPSEALLIHMINTYY